jgi:transcriptional regulator with XRE-family HTH domain
MTNGVRSLNQWRKLRLLTVRELAQTAGVGERTVRNVTAGTPPQLATIRRLSKALQVEPTQVNEFRRVIGLEDEG